MYQRDSLNHVLLSILSDVLCVLFALFIAYELRSSLPLHLTDYEFADIPPLVFLMAPLLWIMSAFTFSLYDATRNYRRMDEAQNLAISSFFYWLVLAGVLYFTFREVSRGLIIYHAIIALVMTAGWRIGLRWWLRYQKRSVGYRTRPTVIVGNGQLGKDAAQMIQAHSWMGLRLAGYVVDTDRDMIDGLPVLGGYDNVRQIIEQNKIEEVVVVLGSEDYDKLADMMQALRNVAVQIRIVPNYVNLALYQAKAENFGGLPLINLRDPALTTSQRLLKRVFDVVTSAMLILATLPVMATVALAVKRTSEGPIIFKQKRVGENGKLFTMYKFRSMYIDAEERQIKANAGRDLQDINHKVKDDPRITPIGHFIRRSSLDELPQLFNVLKGDMSLVGPRPEMPWLLEKYESWQLQRLAVAPGITGWWQVNGRGDKPMHLNTEDDLYYIQNYSFLLDLNILWRTIAVVARGRGAY